MAKKWSPADIQKVMAVSSACSCLVILVGSISIGVVTGRISSDLLGSVKGIGVGGGLVGLAMVLYMVIRVALKTDTKDPAPAGDSLIPELRSRRGRSPAHLSPHPLGCAAPRGPAGGGHSAHAGLPRPGDSDPGGIGPRRNPGPLLPPNGSGRSPEDS